MIIRTLPYKKKTLHERFWDKVNLADKYGCWEWTASTDSAGYGVFGFQGHLIHSHRFAWVLENGEIPEGLHILHQCDNPLCVNLPIYS